MDEDSCLHLTGRCIDVEALKRSVAGREHGAVCVFLGTARDHSDQREVVELCYECYPQMAEESIEDILQRAAKRFSGCRVGAIHRLGLCPLGEASVAVVAAAAHREAAFAACRFVIDTLKKETPIWKQEVYADGKSWVGEPNDPGI